MALVFNKFSFRLKNINNLKTCLSYSTLARKCQVQPTRYHRKNTFNTNTNHCAYRKFHLSKIDHKIVSFNLSDIGEGIREVVIKEWFVKVGDEVSQFDNICEVQSDKAAVTITSRYDGVVTKLYHEVDKTAFVGKPLVDIEVKDDHQEDREIETKEDSYSKTEKVKEYNETLKSKVLTTPSVRRIASQFQVDLSTVKATGKNGRLLKEDILSYLNISAEKSNELSPSVIAQSQAMPLPVSQATVEVLVDDIIVPVSGFTKAMVKSMTEAMKIPHFGLSDEYDVTQLVKSREILKTLAEKYKIKLSYMPLIIKAASLGLSKYPIINSSLDSELKNIIYKANHNIGVAMDTPNGLVVPVIKNVQNKSILDIAQELNTLQEKGTQGQLGLNDLSGGTFTISNIGIVGGTYTKPIILPPQVAIGALGKIQVKPSFDKEGNVVKSSILTVSWSADHRVIDGVTMARFSNQVKEYLEEPYKLLLEL